MKSILVIVFGVRKYFLLLYTNYLIQLSKCSMFLKFPCFNFQVSSINRVLRNLASETQKTTLSQNPMYDKLGFLNGQAWPRTNPWYAPNAPMHGLSMSPPYQPPNPPIPTPPEKKGNSFHHYVCLFTNFYLFINFFLVNLTILIISCEIIWLPWFLEVRIS